MIPKVTQDGPNIMEQYWCSSCGRGLMSRRQHDGASGWSFCPGCGEEIEWDKAQQVKWESMDCDTCGRPMIRELDGHMISTGSYVGTTTCQSCMAEWCGFTNCLGCERGSYPDCKWQYLKRRYEPEGEDAAMACYFSYLDSLRKSGSTNMLGAVPYLQQVFPSLAEEKKAKAVLLAWIEQKRKGR